MMQGTAMKKVGLGLFGIMTVAALGVLSTTALADSDLTGSWRGGGTVTFGSGAKENARCRARFSPASKNSYALSAQCATPSGSVSQTATVQGRGGSYEGSFYNADYDASGTIHIVVRGNKQSVRLVSNKGSALLQLRR
jgi:hypothetical protein